MGGGKTNSKSFGRTLVFLETVIPIYPWQMKLALLGFFIAQDKEYKLLSFGGNLQTPFVRKPLHLPLYQDSEKLPSLLSHKPPPSSSYVNQLKPWRRLKGAGQQLEVVEEEYILVRVLRVWRMFHPPWNYLWPKSDKNVATSPISALQLKNIENLVWNDLCRANYVCRPSEFSGFFFF